MEITVGMKGEASTQVERADTALEVGSGDLLVFATPCMAALMEGAACEAIAPALPEGQTSVGTALQPGAYLGHSGWPGGSGGGGGHRCRRKGHNVSGYGL